MVTVILAKIGSGKGLLPEGTKPLPDLMLVYFLLDIWYP